MEDRLRIHAWLVLAAVGLFAAQPTEAGMLSPALVRQMDRTPSRQTLSVIVHLREQAPMARLRLALQERQATRHESHREVVRALQSAAVSQAGLRAQLDEDRKAGLVVGYTAYWISNLIVVQATPDEVARIGARADVEWVEPNFHPVLIQPVSQPPADRRMSLPAVDRIPRGIRAIHAPQVWYQLGITGAGRIVANLDTGVDGNHPALAARWRGVDGQHPWQDCWLDLLGTDTAFPTPTAPHGTHVMGTMTGLGTATRDTIGVAWGAQWIACNAIGDPSPPDFDNAVLHAFQWFSDPDGNPETSDDVPDVVQNSWGTAQNEEGYVACDSRWWTAIDNCEAAGVVVTWSAGNSGPLPKTMVVPADRATTPTRNFSVGAVDATNSGWPYPIAGFSSCGPSTCDVPDSNKIKPEVVAPGVDVYSSVPGMAYQGNWSGTSMAGPHVAGIVALLRQANPDLDVDSIKRILMETARDEGEPGEDNTYGWGLVDAYAAVQMALTGYGRMDGSVSDASWGGTPLPGASVALLGSPYRFALDAQGSYRGTAPAASYLAVASLAGFRPDTAQVILQGGQGTRHDFSLVDIAGPQITPTVLPGVVTDSLGPYPVQAMVSDPSTVALVQLNHRAEGASWQAEIMQNQGSEYTGSIPGAPPGVRIQYFIRALDGPGSETRMPAAAPDTTYTLEVDRQVYATNFETADTTWHSGEPDDQATSGMWVWAVPVATSDNGRTVQPGFTPGPGTACWVTGNAPADSDPGTNDVDNGCTTLRSPVFSLGGPAAATVTYDRWFGEGGLAADDTFRVDVSSDGGRSWVALERVPQPDTVWHRVTLRLDPLIPLGRTVCFRFRACDLGLPGLVEAAVDNFSLRSFTPRAIPAPPPAVPDRTCLLANLPNPARSSTVVRFDLREAGPVRLGIFDAAGRRVRTLDPGMTAPGTYEIPWNGQDDHGRQVGSGVYYCRLQAGAVRQGRALVMLR